MCPWPWGSWKRCCRMHGGPQEESGTLCGEQSGDRQPGPGAGSGEPQRRKDGCRPEGAPDQRGAGGGGAECRERGPGVGGARARGAGSGAPAWPAQKGKTWPERRGAEGGKRRRPHSPGRGPQRLRGPGWGLRRAGPGADGLARVPCGPERQPGTAGPLLPMPGAT